MKNRYFVSAYATSPSVYEWNSEIEKQYFQHLALKPEIIGVEHPYLYNSEKYTFAWLQENIPKHWSIIITMLPAFMQMSKVNPYFGLASTSKNDRMQAVALINQVNQYSLHLNHLFGKNIVKAVHLHSSPPNDNTIIRGDKSSLRQSLNEISDMKWGDIQLNLEHCDALIPHHAPEKGFLSLEDEIEVIQQIKQPFGIVLNWARSAIEHRSIEAPIKHIELAIKHDLLKGFFFSSCTDNNESTYGYWKDTHMPPQPFISSQYLEKTSLLGYEEIQKALTILPPQVYLGVKVSNQAIHTCMKRSVGLNIETIDAIEHVANTI
jgi:hypothetical protein